MIRARRELSAKEYEDHINRRTCEAGASAVTTTEVPVLGLLVGRAARDSGGARSGVSERCRLSVTRDSSDRWFIATGSSITGLP